jgi:hypothetical protein
MFSNEILHVLSLLDSKAILLLPPTVGLQFKEMVGLSYNPVRKVEPIGFAKRCTFSSFQAFQLGHAPCLHGSLRPPPLSLLNLTIWVAIR